MSTPAMLSTPAIRTRQSPIVPFYDAPLPDELLGSWLFRIAALNGYSTRGPFLLRLGLRGQYHQCDFADATNRAIFLLNAAEQLGISKGAALSTLTTRPYRACFDSREIHPVEFQASRSAAVDAKKFPPSNYFARRNLQICPRCMIDDYRDHGISYIHRSHQLLGTRVCAIHGTALLEKCPSCGVAIRPANSFSTPRSTCSCGHDLLLVQGNVSNKGAWEKLAAFEHESLSLPAGALSAKNAERLLTELIGRRHKNSGRSSPLRALVATYGDEGLSFLRRPLSKSTDSTLILPKSIHIKEIEAPLLGALFVATGHTAREAVALLDSLHQSTISATRPTQTARSLLRKSTTNGKSNSLAKLTDALRLKKFKNRCDARQRYPILFWQLYLEDVDALNQLLPPLRGSGAISIPDVAEDRSIIVARKDGKYEASAWARRQAKARAFLRDREWLETVMLLPESLPTGKRYVDLRWKSPAPATIEEARTQLEATLTSSRLRTRTEIRARRAYVFWFLVLRDLIWFSRRVPPGFGDGDIFVPTIEADRAIILRKLDLSRESREAQIRAYYRDSEWLSRRREVVDLESIEASRAHITQRLIAAREAAMQSPGKPRRWLNRDAARAVGRSNSSLLRVIEKFPELGAICSETVPDYLRRVISWGLIDALASGKSIRLPSLCSSVWSDKSWRRLAYQIRDEVAEKMHAARLPAY